MFNSSKSPFKSFAAAVGLGNQLQSGADSGNVANASAKKDETPPPPDGSISSRLRSMIADIEAGDASYEARRAAQLAARRTDTMKKSGESEPAASVVVPLPPAAPPKPQQPQAKAVDPPAEDVPQASEQTDSPIVGADGLTEAQRLASEQRKAAEALLLEACVLEQRIAYEAKVEAAEGDYAKAKEKADNAAILEQQAKELAQASAERYVAVVSERKEAEQLVATCRSAADAARMQVATLEEQLREAQRFAEETLHTLRTQEQRIAEVVAREVTAEREASEAAGRVTACLAAREAAEKEAKAAQQRAEGVKQALPSETVDFAGMQDVRALAARIAEQASALKQRGSHTGVIEPEKSESAH
jgi:hypothetical protein